MSISHHNQFANGGEFLKTPKHRIFEQMAESVDFMKLDLYLDLDSKNKHLFRRGSGIKTRGM